MLLLAFVAGAVFGGALCLSFVITLVSEVVSTVDPPSDSGHTVDQEGSR
jgi:hypothetical protein